MTTPPPPNQPPQPQQAHSPQAQHPGVGGQPPVGPAAGGQVPGYPPMTGAPQPAPPTPPAGPSVLKRVLRAVVPIVGVIVIAIVVATFFRDKDSGESVNATEVGSCITVSGSGGINVETEAIDCGDSEPSFIVAAKLTDSDACEKAGYDGYVYETGRGAADDVLCLTPNYQVGSCYKDGQFSVGLKLETVPCTETSSSFSTAYKVTQRADSKNVPDCTGPTKKVLASDIKSDPAREVGFCAEILGEGYVWK